VPDLPWLPGFEAVRAEKEIKPFLRWAGGKTRLMPELLPHFPAQFSTYYEPFLGAGSVFFTIRHRAKRGAYLSDLNEDLINVWKVVREKPVAFLKAIDAYKGRDSEVDYYIIRNEAPTEPVAQAARFFYLNQTSWNSLWRVNRWGVFNVPWGARSFRGISSDTLHDVSRVLTSVEIEALDFREALERPRRGDFVYLDPPYLPVSDTSKFAGYTEKRFRLAGLKELGACCEQLSRRGVFWVLSNRDTPVVREIFSFARVICLTTRRSVAAQNRRDVEPVASPEVIVVGRDYGK
jgi:DNA adenine methylase